MAVISAIHGWLTPDEARLLDRIARTALEEFPLAPIIEVGSYHGRSTVVLGQVAAECGGAVIAIDPHDGRMARDEEPGPSTLAKLTENLELAGVRGVVAIKHRRSTDVLWNRPISLLYIDGWHDYDSVRDDFNHFVGWLHGYAAFHDYREDTPGVVQVVNELLADGYREVARDGSMIVIERA